MSEVSNKSCHLHVYCSVPQLFFSSRHTLHQKKFGCTSKTRKFLWSTSKKSSFILNKLKLAMCVQSNCANYHLQTTNTRLMHTGLAVFINIGSKISIVMGKNLASHLVARHTGWETLIYRCQFHQRFMLSFYARRSQKY